MNTPRPYFSSPSDYQPKRTSPDSRFREFVVKCRHCDGSRIKVIVSHDDGETILVLECESCHRKEKISV